MARPFTARRQFTNDVTRLNRLKGAIESDHQRSPEFRAKAIHHLRELILMLTADPDRTVPFTGAA